MDVLRIGRISSLNYEKGTARVVYKDRDNAVTTELPLLSFEYFMPKVDDLVLVTHLPNGAEAGVILGRFWCNSNRPPEYGEGLFRKDLSRDGSCYIKCQDGKMTVYCPGGIEIVGDVSTTGNVTANGTSVTTHTHTDSDGGTTSSPN